MAIKVYCGSGGSGKSLFTVAHEIFPRLVAGGRVVTNIEGMGDPEAREKLFKLVRAAGGPEQPDLIHVGHSVLHDPTSIIWPVDQKKETEDGTRVFDDSKSLIKFGSLVCWDEATAFTVTKLSPLWEQVITYHRHWGLPGSPFDIVILHQSFKNLNVLIRDMTQEANKFVVTSKADVSVRGQFKRPGETPELKMDAKNCLKETFKHPKEFYGTYKSHIADGDHKDTKAPSIWKSKWFRKQMMIIGILLAVTVGGAMYLRQGSIFQQFGPGGEVAKIGSVPGTSTAGPSLAGSGGSVQFTDDSAPQIVGSVPAASGKWVALVRDGARFVEVEATPEGVVSYKGRRLQWPEFY